MVRLAKNDSAKAVHRIFVPANLLEGFKMKIYKLALYGYALLLGCWLSICYIFALIWLEPTVLVAEPNPIIRTAETVALTIAGVLGVFTFKVVLHERDKEERIKEKLIAGVKR